VGIVDQLEVVEIHHKQGHGAALAGGTGQLGPQRVQDGGAVEEAGEAIVGA